MKLTVGLWDALRITRALRAQRVDLHCLPHGELQAPDPSPAKRWREQIIPLDSLYLQKPPCSEHPLEVLVDSEGKAPRAQFMHISSLQSCLLPNGSFLKVNEETWIPCPELLFVLMGRDGLITRVDGAILWAGLLLYIAYLLRQAKQKPAEVPAQTETAVQKSEGAGSPEAVAETAADVPTAATEAGVKPAADTETGEAVPAESPSIWKLIALTIVGLAVILVSSDYAVDAAVALAKIFNISDRVIGLTIVALGTSLPELVTSVTAALRGNADLWWAAVFLTCCLY